MAAAESRTRKVAAANGDEAPAPSGKGNEDSGEDESDADESSVKAERFRSQTKGNA